MRRTLLLATLLSAGCGGESGRDSAVSGVAQDTSGSATLTYANGHPLNWLSTDGTTLAREDEIHGLVNDHRVSLGLAALVTERAMTECARGNSRHLRADYHKPTYWAHENPEGDQPWDRMTANGVVWRMAGENLAAGFGTAREAFDGWLASPGHRANIERAEYRRTGVGYQPGTGTVPYPDDYSTYWTQVFAD